VIAGPEFGTGLPLARNIFPKTAVL
jgi:hypothetical protein